MMIPYSIPQTVDRSKFGPNMRFLLLFWAMNMTMVPFIPSSPKTDTNGVWRASAWLFHSPAPWTRQGRRHGTSRSSTHWLSAPLQDVGVQVAQMVQPHVVLVTPQGVRNRTARGSGFVLQTTDLLPTNHPAETAGTSIWIVTAAHVTPPGYSIQVSWPLHMDTPDAGENTPTRKVPATVVSRNTTLDLALLQVEARDMDNDIFTTGGLALYEMEVPPVGTLVFAHGYPASRLRGPAMTSGIVCGIADGLGIPNDPDPDDPDDRREDKVDATTYVVTNAATSGGMSGGPLVDRNGRVVGITALIRPDLLALGNYAVSSLELVTFLQEAKARLGNATRTNATTKLPTTTILWLYNDRMNKKERVASILNQIAGMNDTLAEQIMMQAHTTGRGNVGIFSTLDEAAALGQALRDQDLLVEWEMTYDE